MSTISEINSKLVEMEELAKEVEEISNYSLPDPSVMKEIDRKMRSIQDNCRWIRQHMPGPYDTEPGSYDTEPGSDY